MNIICKVEYYCLMKWCSNPYEIKWLCGSLMDEENTSCSFTTLFSAGCCHREHVAMSAHTVRSQSTDSGKWLPATGVSSKIQYWGGAKLWMIILHKTASSFLLPSHDRSWVCTGTEDVDVTPLPFFHFSNRNTLMSWLFQKQQLKEYVANGVFQEAVPLTVRSLLLCLLFDISGVLRVVACDWLVSGVAVLASVRTSSLFLIVTVIIVGPEQSIMYISFSKWCTVITQTVDLNRFANFSLHSECKSLKLANQFQECIGRRDRTSLLTYNNETKCGVVFMVWSFTIYLATSNT